MISKQLAKQASTLLSSMRKQAATGAELDADTNRMVEQRGSNPVYSTLPQLQAEAQPPAGKPGFDLKGHLGALRNSLQTARGKIAPQYHKAVSTVMENVPGRMRDAINSLSQAQRRGLLLAVGGAGVGAGVMGARKMLSRKPEKKKQRS